MFDLLITILIFFIIYGMFYIVYHRSKHPNISPDLVLVSPPSNNTINDNTMLVPSNVYNTTKTPSFPEYTGTYTCYVINLDVDIVRLQFFLQSYLQSGLSTHTLIRVPGIIGKTLPMEEYLTPKSYLELVEIEKTGYRTHHHQITRAGVGCYESQLTAMNLIYDSPHPYGLIFEDDVYIDPKITRTIDYMLSVVPDDWNIIVLGSLNAVFINHPLYRELLTFWGCHCYLVNKKGIDIMRQYGGKPYDRQLDHKWCQLVREGKLKIYAPFRDVAWQSTRFGSHIQTRILDIPGIDPFSVDD